MTGRVQRRECLQTLVADGFRVSMHPRIILNTKQAVAITRVRNVHVLEINAEKCPPGCIRCVVRFRADCDDKPDIVRIDRLIALS